MANETIYPYGTGGNLPASIGVINDLTTGGADKALSAEQGVVIREKVITPLLPIDAEDAPKIRGVIVADGTWSTSHTNHDSSAIPVLPGQTYRITANASRNSFYALLTGVSLWSSGGTPSYSSSQSGRVAIPTGTTIDVVIPNDTYYLYIMRLNAGTDYAPQSIYLLQTKDEDEKRKADELRNEIVGTTENLCDYANDSFVYTGGGRIEKVGTSGYRITNDAKTSGQYYLYTLPSGLEDGKTYRLSFDYKSWLSANWWLGVVGETPSLALSESKGVTIPMSGSGHLSYSYTFNNGEKYLRLASNSENAETGLLIENLSIVPDCSTVCDLMKRLARVDNGPMLQETRWHPYNGKKINTIESDYAYGLYMNPLPKHQSSACYGDYMVTFADKMATVKLYNLATQTELATLTLTELDEHHHCNQAFFGTEKYDADDVFPLVYLTVNNDGTTSGGYMEAYRIVPSKGENDTDYTSFTITLVQTVTLPVMSEENALGNANFVLDHRTGYLYTYSRNNDSQADNYMMLRITKWNMPTLSQGNITLTDSDILESWETGTRAANNQGAAIRNHQLFIFRGYQNVGYTTLSVFDLISKTTVAIIDLLGDGFTYEPEGVFFWGVTLCTSTNQGPLYRFFFR